MKTVKTIAWGGSDDNETFLDVLNLIQENAPSARFRIIEAYPNHTGGWPLVEIEFNEADSEWVLEF
jgi:hypothetical protein